MEEVWKKLKGYEDKYLISNLGRIRIKNRKYFLKSTMSNGREYVTLTQFHESKSLPLSRLVAVNFVPNPNRLKYVRHKDKNIANNKASNLFWSNSRSAIKNIFISMKDFETQEVIQIWKSVRSISLWFRKKKKGIPFDSKEFTKMLDEHNKFSMYGYSWERIK